MASFRSNPSNFEITDSIVQKIAMKWNHGSNGSPTAPFKMEWGHRQNNPLSPFLFVLASETFNVLMNRATRHGIMEGLKVGTQEVCVSHLQFADDTLVFCPAKSKWLLNMRRIMVCFQLLSGLKINLSKSGLIVLGSSEDWGKRMANRLGGQLVKLPTKYLGIPLGANPNKIGTWESILTRIRNKLASWKTKTLSRAGRVVLIKAVLNSLPLYYLSIYKAPRRVIMKIVQMQHHFLWQGNKSGRGLPLIRWSIIQKPKALGGLEVDNLIIENATNWSMRAGVKE